MTCTEVQRTIVKSPPELWAELSDPDALARHLAELGEIRITAVEHESAIRWQASDAAGSVELSPSGWGTKVTLSVTRKASERCPESASPPPATPPQAQGPRPQPVTPPQPDPARAESLRRVVEPGEPQAAHVAEPQAARVVEPATAAGKAALPEPSPQLPAHQPEPERQPSEPAEPDSASLSTPPAPAREPTRRGFFGRLFGWRSHEPTEPAPSADGSELSDSACPGGHEPGERTQSIAGQADPQPAVPSALEVLQARYGRPPSAPPDAIETLPAPEGPSVISAELRAAEDPGPGEEPVTERVAPAPAEPVTAAPSDEQTRAILTGVLDRLGAAHHRPFSRA